MILKEYSRFWLHCRVQNLTENIYYNPVGLFVFAIKIMRDGNFNGKMDHKWLAAI